MFKNQRKRTRSQHKDEMVDALHLARNAKTLEAFIKETYGELNSTNIDPQDEQERILVLDTNILFEDLEYVKKIQSLGLGALGFPVVLIPWVVLQELDSSTKDQWGANHAEAAVSFIYKSLRCQKVKLWGQSMQQAAESSNGPFTESNDDRVLQCCLQYQNLYPGSVVILFTNHRILCNKAIVSGVKALSRKDLEAEAGSSRSRAVRVSTERRNSNFIKL